MKVILINTPKGQFHLPLQIVAEHRADYYACEVDKHEKNSPEWQEEVDYAMKDSFEGIDWLINNTNWDEEAAGSSPATMTKTFLYANWQAKRL